MTGRKKNQSGGVREMFCRGLSMAPSFCSGDVVEVLPCDPSEIRKGDVIAFRPPGQDRCFVHRVVSTGPGGIRTRGDSLDSDDSWPLGGEHILGRVVACRREGRRRPVRGGLAGRIGFLLGRAARRLDHRLSAFLQPPYRFLAGLEIFRRILPEGMRPRVVVFRCDGDARLTLIMGKRVIGRRLPGQARWEIRRPFRLFVDERGLP